MIKFFSKRHGSSVEQEMTRAGYQYHCGKDGRPCYHRQLNDPTFPRFHAYAVERNGGMVIDLHFDALDTISHKGNHNQPWAYEGGRVQEEMRRIAMILECQKMSQINGIERLNKSVRAEAKPTNFLDLFFG